MASIVRPVAAVALAAVLASLSPPVTRAQKAADDRAAVRAVAELTFAVVAGEPTADRYPLWAAKTPHKGDVREAMKLFEALPVPPPPPSLGENPYDFFGDPDKPKPKRQPKTADVRLLRVEDGEALVLVAYDPAGNKGDGAPNTRPFELFLRAVKDGDGWKLWSVATPQTDLCRELEKTADADDRAALLKGRHRPWVGPDVVKALDRLAFDHLQAADLAKADHAIDLALEVADFLQDSLSEAWGRLHRAAVRERQQKFAEAADEAGKALVVFRVAAEKQGEAVSLLYQGRALAGAGKFTDAQKSFEAASDLLDEVGYGVPAAERVPGLPAWVFDLLDRQAALDEQIRDNLAADELARAVEKLQSMRIIEARVFGPVHTEIAGTYFLEAQARSRLGDTDLAVGLVTQAAEMRAKLLGPKHWRTINDRQEQAFQRRLAALTPAQRERFWSAELVCRPARTTAWNSADADRLKAARARLAESAQVFRELGLAQSARFAEHLDAVATASLRLGERDAAETGFRECCKLYRDLGVPPDDTNHSASLNDLCNIIDAKRDDAIRKGSVREARRVQEELVTLRTFQFGKKHHGALWSRWTLEHVIRLEDLTPAQRKQVQAARDEIARVEAERAKAAPGAADRKWLEDLLQAQEDLNALLRDDFAVYRARWAVIDEYAELRRYREARLLIEQQGAWLREHGGEELGHPDYRRYLADSGHLANIIDGDLRRAEECHLRVLEMLRTEAQFRGVVYQRAVENLAVVYHNMGNSDRLISVLSQYLQHVKREVFGSQARGKSAAHKFELEKARNPSAAALNRLAGLYRRLGQAYPWRTRDDEAELLLSEAVRVYTFTKAGANSLGDALCDLADIHSFQGRYEEAGKELDRARTLLGDTHNILSTRASLHCRTGKYAAAREIYARLLADSDDTKLGDSGRMLAVLDNLIRVEQLLRHPDAPDHVLRRLQTGQKVLRRLPGIQSVAQMQAALDSDFSLDHLLTLAFSQPGSPALREQALAWVLRRKGIVLETLCNLREDWKLVGLDPKLGDKADRLAELQDKANRLAIDGKPGDPAVERELKNLRADIARLESELSRALADKRPDRFRWLDEASPEAIREKLPPGTALVEFVRYSPFNFQAKEFRYCWLPERYAAFVLRPGVRAVELVDLGEVASLDRDVQAVRAGITTFREAIATKPEKELEADYRKVARTLDDRLFGKLRRTLDGVKTVFVAPDGHLHGVPFAALVGADDRYLIESARFVYLSSGRDLLRAKSSVEGQGAVVVANPDFAATAKERLARLDGGGGPNPLVLAAGPTTRGPPDLDSRGGWKILGKPAQDEGERVAAALKGSDWGPVEFFAGTDALEDRVKAVASPRLLHLATHGFYYPRRIADGPDGVETRLKASDDPLLRSGVVLAGANARRDRPADGVRLDDGWLTAEEVALLNLRGTELVVLSACETGLGDVRPGEGVIGLRRAFLFAGARALITSLFEVPNAETGGMMAAFYKGLAAKKGKLDALHEAQVTLMIARRLAGDGTSHPFYWAGFIYVGEP